MSVLCLATNEDFPDGFGFEVQIDPDMDVHTWIKRQRIEVFHLIEKYGFLVLKRAFLRAENASLPPSLLASNTFHFLHLDGLPSSDWMVSHLRLSPKAVDLDPTHLVSTRDFFSRIFTGRMNPVSVDCNELLSQYEQRLTEKCSLPLARREYTSFYDSCRVKHAHSWSVDSSLLFFSHGMSSGRRVLHGRLSPSTQGFRLTIGTPRLIAYTLDRQFFM